MSLKLGLFAVLLFVGFEPTTEAHDIYSPLRDRAGRNCCDDGDCRPAPYWVMPTGRYVVPGYIAEGCTLLAGRPKLGKSWLVLEMGLAVAMGEACLGGIECEQGEVLYLALEDNERRLQKRIDKVLGQLHEWPEIFQ